jgi:hypothetical protein
MVRSVIRFNVIRFLFPYLKNKTAMRLAILSDLHLTIAEMPRPVVECDMVILAGDIARPQQAIEWARQFSQPVIYVAGNHEFYGGSLSGTLSHLKQLSRGTHVHVLEQEELFQGGVRFLGCTLWTDFRLAASEQERIATMAQASLLIRDFSRIRLDDAGDEPFTPTVSRQIFDQSVAWLERKFAEPWAGPTVVISHHAPSRGSINPKYAESPVNPAFVSDLESSLNHWKPALWIHGHVHDSYDYRLSHTRIVCNPRGYARSGVPENPAFDPHLVVTV